MIDKNILKREAAYLSATFAIFTIAMQAIFYKENMLTTIRTTASIFWLFTLPGFALMYNWHEKLEFIERLIIGTVLGLAITGLIGYNISLIGIHMKYHAIILPAAMLILAGLIIHKK